MHAVSGISLDVREGETLGLVGESGCGKSTTGRAIMQLPPPTSGQVLFEGTDLASLSGQQLREVRTRLQFIFQDPISSLNPRRKVKDIVAEPLRIWKRGTDAEQTARVTEVLDAVGLDPSVAGRQAARTSSPGGQCQRISIARSLVLEPKVIICDEPVSALDVSVQAQILNLLEDMKARYGLTLIFIAHDLAVVKNISDRVAVMYLGKICEVGLARRPVRHPGPPVHRRAAALDPGPRPHRAAGAERAAHRRPARRRSTRPPAAASAPAARWRRSAAPSRSRRSARSATGHFVACHFPLLGANAPEDTPVEVGTAAP